MKNVCKIIAAGLTLFLLAGAAVGLTGLHDHLGRADVGVVLGSQVEPTGLPSERLRQRLERAVELYQQGLFPVILVSGGTGRVGYDEAEAMQRYLVGRGVPPQFILLDSLGKTTYWTAKNTAALMKKSGWSSALVVTQFFHVPRTRLAFWRFGISPVYYAHARYFESRDFYSLGREVIGLCYYLIRRR